MLLFSYIHQQTVPLEKVVQFEDGKNLHDYYLYCARIDRSEQLVISEVVSVFF